MMTNVMFAILWCLMVGALLTPLLLIVRLIVALFSPRLREEIRKRKVLHAVWLVVSVFIALLFIPGGPHALTAAHKAKTETTMNQVQTAIHNYQIEYEDPPPGKTNAALIKELERGNPRGIEFISLKPTDTNANGEILDAWGTPMRITMTDLQHPIIKSAGPDKTWGTPDDMTFSGQYP